MHLKDTIVLHEIEIETMRRGTLRYGMIDIRFGLIAAPILFNLVAIKSIDVCKKVFRVCYKSWISFIKSWISEIL